MEQVVEDEVGADRAREVDGLGRGGEEVGDVDQLHDEEDDPAGGRTVSLGGSSRSPGGNKPVDGGHGRVQGEGRVMEVVLVPDGAAMIAAVVGRLDGIVDGDHDREQPAEQRQDLVRGDRVGAVRLPSGEGVDCAGG